jgi:hypothetical protein
MTGSQLPIQRGQSVRTKASPPLGWRTLWLGLALLCCSVAPLRAEQFGAFTYEVVGGNTVTITYYRRSEVGPVVIPAEIGGKPVTSIGYSAFADCVGLTSVHIPSSVINIGLGTFNGSSNLESIVVEPLAMWTERRWRSHSGCEDHRFPCDERIHVCAPTSPEHSRHRRCEQRGYGAAEKRADAQGGEGGALARREAADAAELDADGAEVGETAEGEC